METFTAELLNTALEETNLKLKLQYSGNIAYSSDLWGLWADFLSKSCAGLVSWKKLRKTSHIWLQWMQQLFSKNPHSFWHLFPSLSSHLPFQCVTVSSSHLVSLRERKTHCSSDASPIRFMLHSLVILERDTSKQRERDRDGRYTKNEAACTESSTAWQSPGFE